MLFTAILSIAVGTGSLGDGGPTIIPQNSFLYQPAFCIDDVLRGPARPYHPQAGDIFLATDESFGAKLGHRLALSGPPHHSGIVFQQPDGSYALLEAGPHNTLNIRVKPLLAHLPTYSAIAKVYIRQRCVPLTCEQSAKLTDFAVAQDGKPFALIRLGGQLTPFRSRGPIRTYFVGGPHGERRNYFCSELVLEACVAACLLNPARTRPAATYPRDIFFGDSLNPFLHKNLDINAYWHPPARWMECAALTPDS
jgi:hypothetical protein